MLLGKFVLFEPDSTVAGHAGRNTLMSDPFNDPATDRNATAIYYMDDNQLRQIIREELGALLDSKPGPETKKDAIVASNAIDNTEIQYQRELVAQQLEYYASVGSISDMDMQKLQGEITKLDEVSRREMLRKLTQALNSGELQGRF